LEIVTKAVTWFFSGSEQVFQFSGGPGTGKSVVLNAIVDAIAAKRKINVAPMAYTGAAAIVMRMKGMPNARTIHSWLYVCVEDVMLDDMGQPIMDKYFNVPVTRTRFVRNDEELANIDLIVIDEGGMVPLEMKDDLLAIGKKILVAGDINQIPPITGSSAFLTTGRVEILTEIMRQAENSAIVYLSQRALHGLPIHLGNYGDCLVIQEHELTMEMLAYANIILCGTNNTREKYNRFYRREIMHCEGPLPHMGEKLICRKNNWTLQAGGINLTNGMSGIVINEPDVRSFKDKLFTIDFNPVLTNCPFYDIEVDYEYFIAPFNRKQELKMLRRPKQANQFDFGYAQTVHTSQGSQWNTGIYIEEPMRDMNKLNYTAISRFSKACIIVKNNAKYYTGGNLL
jgi:exodeoxyribonuclease-5